MLHCSTHIKVRNFTSEEEFDTNVDLQYLMNIK